MSQLLAPGTTAPDFRLPVTPDQDLSLSELRGQRVILSFYPADWSPVCGDQIALYNQVRPEFQKHGAEVLGISVDGAWFHQAYAKHNHIHFPLLADFHPKGAAAQKYGAYREQDGVCERALFVIDRKGVIFWSYLSPIAANPGADGILDALESLQSGEVAMSILRAPVNSDPIVRSFGLSEQRLRDALAFGMFADKVRRDFLNGMRSGVNGTPTFFINNLRYDGPASYEALLDAIVAQLEHIMAPA